MKKYIYSSLGILLSTFFSMLAIWLFFGVFLQYLAGNEPLGWDFLRKIFYISLWAGLVGFTVPMLIDLLFFLIAKLKNKFK